MSEVLNQYARVMESGRRAQRIRLVLPLEQRGAVAIGRIFARQGRAFRGEIALLRPMFTESFHRRLRETPTSDDWDRAWERANRGIRADFQDAMRAMAERGLQVGFEAVAATLGYEVSFDLQNPRAAQFMGQRGARLVTAIDETTRGGLREILSSAIEKGWSYDKVARAIRERFAEFSRVRARVISVTENAYAYEAGSRQAAEMIRANMPPGIVMTKSWITVGDDRVDEFPCGASEMDGWIPLDDEFSGGFDEPPAHPMCRCTAAYSTGPA